MSRLTKKEKKIMEEACAKGVALLDERKSGWRAILRRKVKRGGLYMGSCSGCVLGHLFGDFGVGIDTLQLGLDAHLFGFDYPNLSWSDDGLDYLEKLWLKEIGEADSQEYPSETSQQHKEKDFH